jgi:hypothetical protein
MFPVQRTQRPLSWHPTSHQMPTYTSSPIVLATHHPMQSQYPIYPQLMFPTAYPTWEMPELYMPTGALSNSSSSSRGLPNTSPVWQTTPANQPLMGGNQSQPSSVQPEMNIWQNPINNHGFQEPVKPMTPQYPNILSNIHNPEARILSEEEDEGEVLVGLGLYDDPPEPHHQLGFLKLAESWKLPPSEDSAAEEAEEDETEEATNEVESTSQNSRDQTGQPTAVISDNTSYLQGNTEPPNKEWWDDRSNQFQIYGMGSGTGWVHVTMEQNVV